MKLLIERLLPSKTLLRTEAVFPKVVHENTERFEPMRPNLVTDIEEPSVKRSKMDIYVPNRLWPKTERELPSLTTPLSERLLPIEPKSKSENDSPRAIFCAVDVLLPNCTRALRLTHEPKLTKSKIDTPLPSLAVPNTLVALPHLNAA